MASDSTALPGGGSGTVWRLRGRLAALRLTLAGELVAVGAALALVNAIVFVKQILRGGFYEDDWAFQAAVQYG